MDIFYKTIAGASGINGDSIFVSSDLNLFALSDGASGSFDKVGASNLAIQFYKQNLYFDRFQAEEYLEKSILWANKLLIQKSQNDKALSFATLLTLLIKNNKLYIAGVGDSIVYLIRDNEIKSLYNPLKKYENAIEHEVISRESAERAIENLPDVLRANFDYFIPDVVPKYSIKHIDIIKDDIIFMCSDGINDWISYELLLDIINNDINDTCNMIFDYVDSKCSLDRNDDKSIICFKI